MKVIFLGTGEAFGERANTSILVDDGILLDCGPHTVTQLMKMRFDLRKIELIYLF
jgi:ribonuclease BN (tRNA processing enzyme)